MVSPHLCVTLDPLLGLAFMIAIQQMIYKSFVFAFEFPPREQFNDSLNCKGDDFVIVVSSQRSKIINNTCLDVKFKWIDSKSQCIDQ